MAEFKFTFPASFINCEMPNSNTDENCPLKSYILRSDIYLTEKPSFVTESSSLPFVLHNNDKNIQNLKENMQKKTKAFTNESTTNVLGDTSDYSHFSCSTGKNWFRFPDKLLLNESHRRTSSLPTADSFGSIYCNETGSSMDIIRDEKTKINYECLLKRSETEYFDSYPTTEDFKFEMKYKKEKLSSPDEKNEKICERITCNPSGIAIDSVLKSNFAENKFVNNIKTCPSNQHSHEDSVDIDSSDFLIRKRCFIDQLDEGTRMDGKRYETAQNESYDSCSEFCNDLHLTEYLRFRIPSSSRQEIIWFRANLLRKLPPLPTLLEKKISARSEEGNESDAYSFCENEGRTQKIRSKDLRTYLKYAGSLGLSDEIQTAVRLELREREAENRKQREHLLLEDFNFKKKVRNYSQTYMHSLLNAQQNEAFQTHPKEMTQELCFNEHISEKRNADSFDSELNEAENNINLYSSSCLNTDTFLYKTEETTPFPFSSMPRSLNMNSDKFEESSTNNNLRNLCFSVSQKRVVSPFDDCLKYSTTLNDCEPFQRFLTDNTCQRFNSNKQMFNSKFDFNDNESNSPEPDLSNKCFISLFNIISLLPHSSFRASLLSRERKKKQQQFRNTISLKRKRMFGKTPILVRFLAPFDEIVHLKQFKKRNQHPIRSVLVKPMDVPSEDGEDFQTV